MSENSRIPIASDGPIPTTYSVQIGDDTTSDTMLTTGVSEAMAHIMRLYESLHGKEFTKDDVDKEWVRIQEAKNKKPSS